MNTKLLLLSTVAALAMAGQAMALPNSTGSQDEFSASAEAADVYSGHDQFMRPGPVVIGEPGLAIVEPGPVVIGRPGPVVIDD
jgi:hypothetical protein